MKMRKRYHTKHSRAIASVADRVINSTELRIHLFVALKLNVTDTDDRNGRDDVSIPIRQTSTSVEPATIRLTIE